MPNNKKEMIKEMVSSFVLILNHDDNNAKIYNSVNKVVAKSLTSTVNVEVGSQPVSLNYI